MNILIGTESFFPNISGVSVAAHMLASHMSKRGHQVVVLAPGSDFNCFREEYDGYPVWRLPAVRNPFRMDFNVTCLPTREVDTIFKQERPDVVHLHDPGSISWCLLQAARCYHVPVVISHHFTLEYTLTYLHWAGPLKIPFGWWLRNYLKRFYNHAGWVISPSDRVAVWLARLGIRTPISAISNGVDLDRFFSYYMPSALRSRFGLGAGPVVLYVGRIDKDKSLEVTIRAVPLARAAIPSVQFVLCGTGDVVRPLRDLAEQTGVGSTVRFIGPLRHDDEALPQIYQAATLFLIPSAIEVQSLVTLEAMASGLPIVAARAGGSLELVEDGVNGLLFEPGSAEDAAAKVIQLLTYRALTAQMREENLKKAGAHAWQFSMDQVEQIYERLAG